MQQNKLTDFPIVIQIPTQNVYFSPAVHVQGSPASTSQYRLDTEYFKFALKILTL